MKSSKNTKSRRSKSPQRNELSPQESRLPLTSLEKDELAHLEEVIKRGWETFLEVGHALAEIRNRRLYRDAYGSFGNYCRQRWGYGRSKSYYLIAAAETAEKLSTIVDSPKPEHESQLRPLIGLPVDKAVKVWQRAAAKAQDGKITAQAVVQALQDLHLKSPSGRSSEHGSKKRAPEQKWRAWRLLTDLQRLVLEKAPHDELKEKLDELENEIEMLQKNGYFEPKPNEGIAA